MKLIHTLALINLLVLPLSLSPAAPKDPSTKPTKDADADHDKVPDAKKAQEHLVKAIKTSEDIKELEFHLKNAQDAGAKPQQLAEARLLWAVFHDNWAEAEGFAKAVAELAPKWNTGDALLWKKPNQLEAIPHLIAAMIANEKEDAATAKKEILEAVWLDSESQTITAKLKELRPAPAVKVPMDVEIKTADGKTTTLAAQVKGKKALYVQVWATWCGPCIRLLPVLDYRSKALPSQGVAVIALNSELGGDDTIGGNLSKAKERREKTGYAVPWLIDPRDDKSYAQLIEIDSVPRALIIDPEGNVVFNEHPVSDKLPKALAKYGAKLDSKREAEIIADTEK